MSILKTSNLVLKMNKEFAVIKSLAELGYDVTPKQLSPNVEQTLARIKEYEKELGHKLDPQELVKYLG